MAGKKKVEKEGSSWVGEVEKYSRQIWLAGLGAYSKISNDGSKLFETLVKDGEKAEKQAKNENTFETVARSWYKTKSVKWTPAYGERLLRRLERDLFPAIGRRPIADILERWGHVLFPVVLIGLGTIILVSGLAVAAIGLVLGRRPSAPEQLG